MAIHCFTSFTLNYIAKARLLAETVREHQPEWVFHALICEPVPEWFDLRTEPFDDLLQLEQLQIAGLPGWVFARSVVEVCTGAKGPALHYLLNLDDVDAVVYLDPDIAVFAPLDAVSTALRTGSVVLTPHQLAPDSDPQAVIDNEICSLSHGIYNLGFIAVANNEQGHHFARWWRDRLIEHCYDDRPRGLFTDQRWCDLVPAFFDRHVILRSPAYNVATWNLTHREVTTDDRGRINVNGDEHLAFYHFTGYDSGAGRTMLDVYAPPGSVLFDLWEWYDNEIADRGQEFTSAYEWRWARFDNGELIDPQMRRLYRRREDLRAAFPDPFATPGNGEMSFLTWWNDTGDR